MRRNLDFVIETYTARSRHFNVAQSTVITRFAAPKIQARTAASRKHPGGALQGGCGVVRYASAIREALGMPPRADVGPYCATKIREGSRRGRGGST